MADVNSGSRGQMLLVAAFGLAVMLVALALVVNTAIYTENIATRSSDIGGGKDAARFHDGTEQTTIGLVEYANYNNNTSYADLETAVEDGVENYSDVRTRHAALSGTATNVTIDSQSRGTRIYQLSDGDFHNDTGTTDWTLAQNANGVRNFTMNVSKDSLTESTTSDVTGLIDPAFNVTFDNGTDTWTVFLYKDSLSTNVNVTVEGPSTTETCSVTVGGRAVVNVSRATINGTDCPALDLLDDIEGDYDLSYKNTEDTLGNDLVTGTYWLVVNTSTGNAPSAHYDDPAPPDKTVAIYSVTLDVTYESRRLFYTTRLRVAPKEGD